ncbi:hypothetical protein AUP68_05068 [Ilyonectria robusta]
MESLEAVLNLLTTGPQPARVIDRIRQHVLLFAQDLDRQRDEAKRVTTEAEERQASLAQRIEAFDAAIKVLNTENLTCRVKDLDLSRVTDHESTRYVARLLSRCDLSNILRVAIGECSRKITTAWEGLEKILGAPKESVSTDLSNFKYAVVPRLESLNSQIGALDSFLFQRLGEILSLEQVKDAVREQVGTMSSEIKENLWLGFSECRDLSRRNLQLTSTGQDVIKAADRRLDVNLQTALATQTADQRRNQLGATKDSLQQALKDQVAPWQAQFGALATEDSIQQALSSQSKQLRESLGAFITKDGLQQVLDDQTARLQNHATLQGILDAHTAKWQESLSSSLSAAISQALASHSDREHQRAIAEYQQTIANQDAAAIQNWTTYRAGLDAEREKGSELARKVNETLESHQQECSQKDQQIQDAHTTVQKMGVLIHSRDSELADKDGSIRDLEQRLQSNEARAKRADDEIRALKSQRDEAALRAPGPTPAKTQLETPDPRKRPRSPGLQGEATRLSKMFLELSELSRDIPLLPEHVGTVEMHDIALKVAPMILEPDMKRGLMRFLDAKKEQWHCVEDVCIRGVSAEPNPRR